MNFKEKLIPQPYFKKILLYLQNEKGIFNIYFIYF